MRVDIGFLVKYWSKHKQNLFFIIISAIVLVVMLFFSGYMERTEVRRDLHSYYDTDGAFDVEYRNVDTDTINLIETSDVVSSVGEVYCIGKCDLDDSSVTIGGFTNSDAEMLAHYPLQSGRLPANKGEIAITSGVLKKISPFSNIGDNIDISFNTFNDDEIISSSYTLVGIFDDFERTTFENPIYGIEFCDPRIILSNKDIESFPDGYTNLMFQFKNGERMALADEDDEFEEENYLTLTCFERGYSLSGTGRLHGIQIIAMSQDENDIDISPKLKMVKTITIFAVIISIISMFSILMIVLQNRLNSFQMMRCVGYSKKRIIRLLMVEMIGLFVIATSTGLLLGYLIYEGVLYFQNTFFDLPIYKGYYSEWIVEQKTINPIVSAIITEIITIAISYLIITIKLSISLTSFKKMDNYYKLHHIKTIYGIVDRILTSKGTAILQIISLSSLIFISIVGYLYCTPIEKGTSVVSMTTMSVKNSNKTYEVLDEIDLKKEKFDALLESTNQLSSAAYLAPHTIYGISESDLTSMKEMGITKEIGWSNWFHLILSVENTTNETLLSNIISDEESKIIGFDSNSVAAIPCILVNDELYDRFLRSGEINDNNIGAIWVSVYGSGDEFEYDKDFRLYSIQADSTGWLPNNTISTDFKVADNIKINTQSIDADIILRNVVNELKNYSGFFVITGKYANEIGIYNNKYDKVLIYGESDESSVKAAISNIKSNTGAIDITTIFDLKKAAAYNFIFNYLTIILLYLFLFLIFIIGFGNMLNLSLQRKSQSLAVTRCMGVNKKTLTKCILLSNLKIPVISSLFGGSAVIVYRLIMKNKYSLYCSLINKRDELYNSYGKEDELDTVQKSLRILRNRYLLGEEMWIPSWHQIFIILSCFILLFTVFIVMFVIKKQIKKSLKDQISEMQRE